MHQKAKVLGTKAKNMARTRSLGLIDESSSEKSTDTMNKSNSNAVGEVNEPERSDSRISAVDPLDESLISQGFTPTLFRKVRTSQSVFQNIQQLIAL